MLKKLKQSAEKHQLICTANGSDPAFEQELLFHGKPSEPVNTVYQISEIRVTKEVFLFQFMEISRKYNTF